MESDGEQAGSLCYGRNVQFRRSPLRASGISAIVIDSPVFPAHKRLKAMKVRASVRRICENCKIVRRKGVVRVICSNTKHKQKQG